jgi:hypothetical protein
MPQRAATFARRPSGTRAAERARSMGEPAGVPVPLDLRALLAPYKRHRGLTIRVERLLHGARLTHGRNNGDRSWSLFPDDLEGLEYLPAAASYEAHTLAVRIISLDGGDGETLSVHDLPIAGIAPAPAAQADTPVPDASHAAEMAQLREELTNAKSLLATRDAELSEAAASLAAREGELAGGHHHADQIEHARSSVQPELAAARQVWEHELQQRLSVAEAESKAALDKARADLHAEQGSRLTHSETDAHRAIEDVRRRAREDRQAWEQELQQHLSAAESESKAALDKARADWQAEQGSRLIRSGADAHRAIEDVRRRAQEDRQAWEQELQQRLSAAEAASKATLVKARADWETEQGSNVIRSEASAHRAIEDVRRHAREELDAALSQSRSDWKASEAVRFAAAEAVWRDEASKTAADLRTRAEAAEKALAETNSALSVARSTETDEVRQLREQLGQSHANLAARGAELAEARAATELARKATRDGAADLRRAEQEWKLAEATRLAASEAEWNERSGNTVAEVSARLDAAESLLVEARAQAEARSHQVSIAQAALRARDSELEQLRSASEQARLQLRSEAETAARRQREMEAELARAQEEWKAAETARFAAVEAHWKADEAARFVAAEAQWQTRLDAASAGNTKEVQDAQGALVQAHVELQMLRDSSHRQIRQLRDDLSAAQISLSARESELASMHTVVEHAHASADRSSEIVAIEVEKAREKWKLESDIAWASAEAAWHADETPRIAAAAAKLQEDAAGGFIEITGKLQSAETALADSKACAEALRRELTAAQTSLCHREFEFAEAQELFAQERERLKHVPISTHEPKPRWETDEEERRAQFRRRLVRDFAIVACLSGLAFVAYPRVQPVVADAWPRNLSFQGKVQPWLQMAGLARLPPAPPFVEPHAIVEVRSANLRIRPASGAHIVMRLTRNMGVTPVEHQGKWVFVRVGDGANQQQGWVLSSVLKDQEVAVSATPQD